MNKTIGTIVSDLRKRQKLSQENLAFKLNCSREFISQLENDRRSIPDHFIIPLSIALDYDFSTLIANLHKFNTIEHFMFAHKIIDAIEEKNISKICNLLNEPIVEVEFTYGYPLTLKLYCQAMKLSIVDNNYIESNKVCSKVLEIESFESISKFVPKLYNEERYYSTILIASNNLFNLQLYDYEQILLKNTICFLELNYFNTIIPISTVSLFFKRFYITVLNNYADLLFAQKDFNTSFIICQKAIDFATKNDLMFLLNLLLCLKIKILYKLGNLKQARYTYLQFKSICEITYTLDYFEISTLRFKKHYPNLLLK